MALLSLRSTEHLCRPIYKSPSPPFRAEREGPAKREGEVGLGNRSGFPHLTPALSAPGGGEGDGKAAYARRGEGK